MQEPTESKEKAAEKEFETEKEKEDAAPKKRGGFMSSLIGRFESKS